MTKKPKRGRPIGTTTGKDSVFARWREAMGFGVRQVSKAGSLLGLTTPAASMRNRGRTDSDLMERLAMSALRAGLPPWSPKADAEIMAVSNAVAFVRHAAENQAGRSSKAK